MSRIIANMVVRNEADKWLESVLERVMTQVDELCLTDDCSTDNTVEIARKFTDKIQVMSEPIFATNEGALRQKSWDFLEQHVDTNDDWWVLAIDADEMLYETRHSLEELTNQKRFDVLSIEFYHMWSDTHFRVDKA
jgi:glycosyltransferase involved in cell wall biosynthesis